MTKLKLFLYASAALLPAVAHAQSEDDQIVVVASGVEQEAETTGRSITVLDREAIETRQTVSLSDLLATTPGVTSTRTGGPGNADRAGAARGDLAVWFPNFSDWSV